MVDKIPTIATQLKIITAVKATRQGGDGEGMMVTLSCTTCTLYNYNMYPVQHVHMYTFCIVVRSVVIVQVS